MMVYNHSRKLLIVKDELGKIIKAYGGAIAKAMWQEKVTQWAYNSQN